MVDSRGSRSWMVRRTVSPPTPESNTPTGRLSGMRRHRSNRGVVAAPEVVEANGDDVAQHRPGILQRPDLGVVIEPPLHGKLRDPVAQLAGEVEDLDVERPAGDGLEREKRQGRRPVEGLEA